MKVFNRFVCILMCSIIMLLDTSFSTLCAQAIDFNFNIRTYDIFFYNTKTGHITDVNESEGRTDIVIPEEINGIAIVGIDELAFSLYPQLKTVKIPDSVVSIADNAFENTGSVIVCNPNSYAEQWAKSHNQKYNTGNTKPFVFETTIIVYQNKKDMTSGDDDYEKCENAEVLYKGGSTKTDKDGIAKVPYGEDVVIKKDGYCEETVNANNFTGGQEIYLEKNNVKTPIIKAVTVDNVNARAKDITVFADETKELIADIDWNGNSEYLVYLDNGLTKVEIKNGTTGDFLLGGLLNKSQSVKIVAESKNGYKVSKKLLIKVSDTLLNGDKYNVSFGDGIRNIGSGALPYIDMSFDFDIPNFPAEICLDGNKLTLIFGVDVAEWGYKNDYWDKKKGEWDTKQKQAAFKSLKEIISDTKKQMDKNASDQKKLGEQYSDLKKKLKDTGKVTTAKFGYEADVSFTGYAEFTFDQNGMYFSDGGFIFAAEAKAKFAGEFMIWVIPCNWEASIKGEVAAQLALLQRTIRSQKMEPEGTIKGSVTLKVGVGPGLRDLHANICGSGAIKPGWTFSSSKNAITLDVDLSLFIEAVAWKWSNQWELASTTFHLYPKEQSAKLMSVSEIYSDIDDYKLIGREYANKPSEFINENEKVQLMSENYYNIEDIIKSNTYTHTTPQVIGLGEGKKLLVWVDDDLSRTTINGTYIAYSLYDGITWSTPQYVENDGTADFNPVLKEVNGTTYLAWENVNKVLDNNAELNDMAAAMEIKTAVYDVEHNRFYNVKQLTNNNYVDTDIAIGNGIDGAVISWKANKQNDLWTVNKSNEIHYAVINDQNVVSSDTLANGLSVIDSSVVIQTETGIVGYYIADTDNDLETNTDNEIFVVNNGVKSQITNNELPESGLAIFENNIYYYSNGTLSKISDYLQSKIEMTEISIPNNNFVVLNNGNTIIYEDGIDAIKEIYGVFYDETSERWSDAVKLTNLNARVGNISGFYNVDGSIVVSYDKKEVVGTFDDPSTLFGTSNLAIMEINPSTDIAISSIYYDKSMLAEGNIIDLEVDVTNKGISSVDGMNFVLTDDNQNKIINTLLSERILPGETKTYSVPYCITENFEPFNAYAEISTTNRQDKNIDDNTYALEFNYADICLENVSYLVNDDVCNIYATVSNYGFAPVNEVSVVVKDNDINGKVIATQTIRNLSSRDCSTICINGIDADTNYYIEAISSADEDMLGNNTGFILLKGTATISKKEYVNNTANITIDNGKGENISIYVAEYSNDGALIEVLKKDIKIEESSQMISLDYKKVNQSNIVKIFVWKDDMIPLQENIK